MILSAAIVVCGCRLHRVTTLLLDLIVGGEFGAKSEKGMVDKFIKYILDKISEVNYISAFSLQILLLRILKICQYNF